MAADRLTAVVGVVLWKDLAQAHLGALLGPWAETVQCAGIG